MSAEVLSGPALMVCRFPHRHSRHRENPEKAGFRTRYTCSFCREMEEIPIHLLNWMRWHYLRKISDMWETTRCFSCLHSTTHLERLESSGFKFSKGRRIHVTELANRICGWGVDFFCSQNKTQGICLPKINVKHDKEVEVLCRFLRTIKQYQVKFRKV